MSHIAVVRPLIPSHSVIDSENEHAYYWKAFMGAWRVPKNHVHRKHYHPGCNPRSLARSDLQCVHQGTYLIALKSDGVRYALFLTMRQENTPVALMIDRARNMYEVEVVAPEDYFLKNTILEGELVWQQPNEQILLFLVFDAVSICGENLMNMDFAERLKRAARCTQWAEELRELSIEDVEQRVIETDSIALTHFSPRLIMRPKVFVERKHATRLWLERGDCEHRVDGIILHNAHQKYSFGTAPADAVYKWKEHCTIDLSGPCDALQASDGPVGDTFENRPIQVMSSRVVADDNEQVVEYHVRLADSGAVLLQAIRKRPDKVVANGLRVVHATMQDVIDDVKPSELNP